MPKTYSTRQSVGIARKAMISHSIEKSWKGERVVVVEEWLGRWRWWRWWWWRALTLNGERRVSEMSRAWCNAINSECVTVAVER